MASIASRWFAPIPALTLLGGCASFDPHNLVGRHLAPVSGTGVETGTTLAATTRRAAVDAVWSTINERYYRADLNGVNWSAARTYWEPLALVAATDDEFWERVDLMVAELSDAHTRVESPRQVMRRKTQQSLLLGIGLREIAGEIVVTSVHSESDAYWAGVRAGMLLHKIGTRDANGQWNEWLKDARKTSSPQAASRGPMRKLNAAALAAAESLPPQPLGLTFLRADGSELDAKLKPVSLSTRPVLTQRVLPSGVGYVRISAFSESLRGALLDAVTSLHRSPALILDLRGNGGGSAAMAEALIGSFVKTKTIIARAETRTGSSVTIGFGVINVIELERSVPGRPDAYGGRVAVLIDRDSGSASEGTAAVLQEMGRAAVVGEVSCGCLLMYLGYTALPGGGELAFSEVGFTTVKGKRIEGIGVIPDIVVTPTRADIGSQRDRALEAAEAALLAK